MPNDELLETVGDATAGFSIALQAGGRVVRVVGWGFLGPEAASQLDLHVLDVCARQPRPSELVLDLSELKPLRDEGQVAMANLLRKLPDLGPIRVTMVIRSQLTRLQLLRLVREHGQQAGVTFA